MNLAVFDSWDGPSLTLSYRWGWLLVLAVGLLCPFVLAVQTARRKLTFCSYTMLCALPLFFSLVLSVGVSLHMFVIFYGPTSYMGPPADHVVLPSLLWSIFSLACSAFLLLVFGVAWTVRARPNQALQPTAGRSDV
jgi:hypothetical protein